MATIEETGSHLVRGNSAFLLDRSDVIWRVESGCVAIFSVGVQEGKPSGPRRYLFTCRRNDVLFGSSPSATQVSTGFLLVGLEESRLKELPYAALAADGQEETAHFGEHVASWVRHICAVVNPGADQVHADKVDAGHRYQLAADQSVKPAPDDVLWVNVESGSVNLVGNQELNLPAGDDWIPLGGGIRLTAAEDAQVVFHDSASLPSLQSAMAGIARLHELCFRFLAMAEQRERQAEAQRVRRSEQLQARDTSAAIHELTNVVFNRADAPVDPEDALMAALMPIGRAMNLTFRPAGRWEDLSRREDPVEAVSRASHIRARRVSLAGEWWKSDAGPLLAFLAEDKRPVALLRSKNAYVLFDPQQNRRVRVDRNVEQLLEREARSFIRPLPDNPTSLVNLGRFATRPFLPETAIMLCLSAAIAILGMLVPLSTQVVIDLAIPDADVVLLYQLAAGLIAMALGQAAFSYSQDTVLLRMDTGVTANMQSAVMDRLLRLPTRFFRKYSSGDLQNRAMMVSDISQEIGNNAIGAMLTGGMAVLNIALCYYYSARLAVIAVVSAVIVSGYTAGLSSLIRGSARKLGLSQGKIFGMQVQLISGISKIRIAGAEQRAFNHWAKQQARQLRVSAVIQRLEGLGGLINTGLNHATTICLYYFAAALLASDAKLAAVGQAGSVFLTMGAFLAFNGAFMSLIAGMTQLSGTIVNVAESWAKRKLVLPLLEAKPEITAKRADPGRLQGGITVNEVSFRYREDGPLILNGVSLQANPGDFVALVGPSGCGKSTLLRILLGFETPEAGTICFDGQDLSGIDVTAVRRQFGVVLQSGSINAGSIFDNIAGAAVITLDEAWEAAQDAGFAEDVQSMPMEMHTYLNEGGGTLSGGQRQRLLIARALVTKPKILIFDEATSALDNRTQAIVSESLIRRQVTRIVVAHRLSTIQDATRIYVMENGHVIQSGTYEELAKAEGLFQRMIARQLA